MSEISVVVVGSTSVNSVVGNGDTVNVSIGGDGGAGGQAASVQVGTVTATSLASTASATAVVENVGTAYAAKLNMAFGIPRGVQGVQGDPGPVNQITLGTVQTGPDAAAELTGTSPNQTLNLTLPQGPQGQQGIQGIQGIPGPANSLSLGSVTTGTTAAVSITGASPSQQISFVLPLGPTGETGPAGPATTVQVGTTTTGVAGSSAKVETTTVGNTVTLSFTVPRGADGTANLADETPQPLGAANAGTALAAARADHVHPLQVVSYTALTNVPLAFTPTSHSHATSEITGLQAALDTKQPAGSYATLVNGTVPSSQLPGFVDDIVEYANLAAFPASGEVGKLYVSRDNNKVWRWSGSTYVEISASPGSTDAVPEGSVNLYHTTARAAAAAPVQSVNGKTGEVTVETVSLSSSTPAALGTASAGVSTLASRADHAHARPTYTDVGAAAADHSHNYVTALNSLTGSLSIVAGSNVTITPSGSTITIAASGGGGGGGGIGENDAVDGGSYTGVIVAGEIQIAEQPISSGTVAGVSATISVQATYTAPLLYQWQRSSNGTTWADISGATASSYSWTETTAGAYYYRVIVSATGATSVTSTAAQWVFSEPAAPPSGIVITQQPSGGTVYGNAPSYVPSTVTLSVVAEYSSAISYQWQYSADGIAWSNASNGTASAFQVGYYSAASTPYWRCVLSASGTASVTSASAYVQALSYW
jgi:hypothetical protein